MRASAYGKALAAVAVVAVVVNAVATNVFVAAMNPQDWNERVLPALGWALVLAALTTLFVLVSTVWLRGRPQLSSWTGSLLAFAGPAIAWVIIGLIIGAWLFPLYAFYGLGSGVVASVVFILTLRRVQRSGEDRQAAPPPV